MAEFRPRLLEDEYEVVKEYQAFKKASEEQGLDHKAEFKAAQEELDKERDLLTLKDDEQ